jgi:hypothetical protein
MRDRRISGEVLFGLVGLGVGLILAVVSAAAGFWYGQQRALAGRRPSAPLPRSRRW